MIEKTLEAQNEESKAGSSFATEVDHALSGFEVLTITGTNGKNNRGTSQENNQAFGSLRHLFGKKSSGVNTESEDRCLSSTKQRFRPYNIAYLLKRHSKLNEKNVHDASNYSATLSSICLGGCEFNGSSLGGTSKSNSKPNAKPCWLQHQQEGKSQGTSLHCSTQAGGKSSSSPGTPNESAADFEVEELSEYFEHFVSVRLKMSSQAESMYA
ncbi:hypothetical protein Ddc_06569 [Ditylenchus destructor]|nr:hypothetical protein Ddc_06569 [Ditylenchus destructor]